MPKFPSDEGLSDRDRLLALASFIRDALWEIVENGKNLDESLLDHVKKAWYEIKEAGYFPRLETALEKASETDIRDHGLFGNQLNLKWNLLRHLWNEYVAKGGAKLLARFLGAIDAILDSMIDVAGVGKAIKEFKDSLLGAISE